MRDLAHLESLRPALAPIRWHELDADLDVYLAHLRTKGHAAEPRVVLVRKNEAIVAAAMCRLEEAQLSVRLGYRLSFRPSLPTLVVVHGGYAGAEDDTAARALVGGLRQSLDRDGSAAVYVPGIPVGSTLHHALLDVPALCRGHFEYRRARRTASVGGSYESFLRNRSRNTRHTIKRYRRRFLERVPGYRVRVFQTPAELGELVDDLELIAGAAWQRRVGGGFEPTPGEVEVYGVAMQKGLFRAWLLYDEERPIAFWLGWRQGSRFKARYTGYDPGYADCRPGLFLLGRLVQDLCDDELVDELDFGAGDSQLKRSFTDEQWLETDAVLFAPRPIPVAVNVARSVASGAASIARDGIRRFERVDRARRRWRSRAVARGAALEVRGGA